VKQNKEKSPILTPNLHGSLSLADEDRIKRDLSFHTLRSFLIHRQEQGHLPKAAHQNVAPQDHMEQDLHSHHGRSHPDTAPATIYSNSESSSGSGGIKSSESNRAACSDSTTRRSEQQYDV